MSINYLWQSSPNDDFIVYDETYTTSLFCFSQFEFKCCHSCATIQLYKGIKSFKENIIIGIEDFKEEFIAMWDSLFTNIVIPKNTYIKAKNATNVDIRREIIESQCVCD